MYIIERGVSKLKSKCVSYAGNDIEVEFRHRTWADDRVFTELEKRRVALVAADVPELPRLFSTTGIVTNPELFYSRFHGRNLVGRRSGNMQKHNVLDKYHWGLVPFWAKDTAIGYKMINARAETVATKPSFREAFKKRRCR